MRTAGRPTLQVTVHLDPELHDLLLAELSDRDFHSFQSEGDRFRAYGPGTDWEEAKSDLEAFMEAHDQPAGIEEEWITPANWNESWEREVTPIAAGPFVVTPSWEREAVEAGEYDLSGEGSEEGEQVIIEVDPKMSFGTGHHPSTRLALDLAARRVQPGHRILDAGAGTGVLSVAAVRLGADRVVAFDNSPPAFENGREILERNDVADRVDYRMGELEVVDEDETFDGILANINEAVLTDVLPKLAEHLAPGGFVIVSGLLDEARDRMKEVVREAGLMRTEEQTEEDWFAWTLRPRASGRVATIDVGTNTVLLLVSEVDARGRLVELDRAERFARLGAGVDASGALTEAAMRRVEEVIGTYRERAERWGVDEIVAGGTSAVRDARNADVLIDRVRQDHGVELRPLTGAREGELTFRGALSGSSHEPGSYVVLDIGGGSTELIGGRIRPGRVLPQVERRVSIDVGAVRLTERYFDEGVPVLADLEKVRSRVGAAITRSDPPREGTLIGASGTTVALALLAYGVRRWEALPQPHVELSLATVRTWARRLERRTPEEILALNPDAMAGREDVFTAGLLVLESVMDAGDFERLEVSARGIRYGMALEWGMERQ